MAPAGEALDPALLLDDWINRVANLPEEIRFLQDEIADRDRRYNDCLKAIEDRDARLQKWIKAHGSHEPNPREDGFRTVIAETFDKAERLADEKVALAHKMQAVMDRHVRQLDMQIKLLYDRNEPGFTDPDELPSLLRPGGAAHLSTLSVRSAGLAAHGAGALAAGHGGARNERTPTPAATGGAATNGAAAAGPGAGRGANLPPARQAASGAHPASAPASPAASMLLGRQAREGSAGPGPGPGKRGPRSSLSNVPATSSGLARHSSLGPGLPKHHTATGTQRAGSAGPRAPTKGAMGPGGRKAGTPSVSSGLVAAVAGVVAVSGPGRKKNGGGPSVKTFSRVKRPAKNSATSSTADSELSDADSASESNASSRRGTPARSLSHGTHTASAGTGVAGGHHGHGPASDKEGSAQPPLKRERDSLGGLSGVTALSTAMGGGGCGSGGSSGGNGSSDANSGSSGGGGGGGHGSGHHGTHRMGVALTKHAPRGAAGGTVHTSDDRMDLDEDEAGDDRKYCLCQNVSFGDMVACDNEDCPYEWFHWSCVGLKSEPNGTWYCPVCTANMGGTGTDIGTSTGSGMATGLPTGTGAGAGPGAGPGTDAGPGTGAGVLAGFTSDLHAGGGVGAVAGNAALLAARKVK